MKTFVIDELLIYAPTLIAVVGIGLLLSGVNRLFRRNLQGEVRVSQQLIMLALTSIGVLIVIFALPLSETSRGQLLSSLGIVVTAVIALSSTTFVANVMAGLMLRAVNSFRPGDFVRCDSFFGRVTERGIFHTEIQTEDRDLTTLPNMFLVTNPVTVVRGSGTIVSAHLSLGYDISHTQIEALLTRAAEQAGLDDAFVLIGELGDFSVSYRVGGFFKDVSRLLTAKSRLRKEILDVMHESGIEIVSPNFMNQRVLQAGEKMIPRSGEESVSHEAGSAAEDVIFDKADTAAEKEVLKEKLAKTAEALEEIDAEIKQASDEGADKLKSRRTRLLAQIERMKAQLSAEESPENPD
ncbi:MAG TPA: mechanosensitive ion channel domain-containing protein [Pseudomonadales bacterium]|nr:mechanosensitive ion channel domain-containing protein [Pseudomonadales bacterium]